MFNNNFGRKEMKYKIIPIDIYCRDILVVFGDVAFLRKAIRKYHTQEQTDAIMNGCNFDNNQKGKTIYSSYHNAFILWLNHTPQSAFDMQFLAHEIFHAANAILVAIGVNLSYDSEEAYAYLIGFLTKRIIEEFSICSFEKSSDPCRVLASAQTQQGCEPATE